MRILRISYDEDPSNKGLSGGGRNVKELLDKFSSKLLFTDLFTRNITLERYLESPRSVKSRFKKVIKQNIPIDTEEKWLNIYLGIFGARKGKKVPRKKLMTYELVQYSPFTRIFRVPYFPDMGSTSVYVDVFDLPALFAKKVRDFFVCFVNPDWSHVPPRYHIPKKIKQVTGEDISSIYKVTHDIIHTHHFRSLQAAYLVLSDCEQYRNVPWIHTPHLLRIKDSEGNEEEFYRRLSENIDLTELIFGGYAYFFKAPLLDKTKHETIRKFREYFHIEKRYFSFVDHFIARSEEEKSVLMNYYHIPRNRISVITGGVNPEDWSGIIKKPPRKKDQIILISTSRISKQKNLNNSIEITMMLENQGYNVTFTNFGKEDDPNYRKALTRKIKRYKLEDNFFLEEHLSNIELIKEYERAHFFVHPSNYESFGLSILEAMASGTPVIVTNKGGPNEFISNGKDGFLVDPARPEKYADIIISVLKNPTEYEQVSLNAINKANQLSWDNYVENHIEVYERVLYKFRRKKKIVPEPLFGFDSDLRIERIDS